MKEYVKALQILFCMCSYGRSHINIKEKCYQYLGMYIFVVFWVASFILINTHNQIHPPDVVQQCFAFPTNPDVIPRHLLTVIGKPLQTETEIQTWRHSLYVNKWDIIHVL